MGEICTAKNTHFLAAAWATSEQQELGVSCRMLGVFLVLAVLEGGRDVLLHNDWVLDLHKLCAHFTNGD